jgi:F420H2 dehydrogenase subunit N
MISAGISLFIPLFIAAGGVASYFIARCLPSVFRRLIGYIAAGWLFAAFIILFAVTYYHTSFPGLSFIGLTGGLLITGIGAMAMLASQGMIGPEGQVHLYYPLLLLALAGAVATGFATDLFTVFVMVELSAIPVYALCAYRYREDPEALPAAYKYLVQGAAGTATALLGVSLLYLASGTLAISDLPAALAGRSQVLLLTASVLVILGYGVKLAIVPLHTWLPDAYAKAPAPVTAVMVGATKTGVLIGLFLTLSALPAGPAVPVDPGIVVTFLAVVTMTVGNLLALNQKDIRYVLSYSSIAQMGYILLGFGIGMIYHLPLGFTAGLYYAIAYSLTKSGAFLAAEAFARRAGSYEVARMKGVGASYPLLGIAFLIFVLGLIGVPFTCAFLGKMLLEQAGMVTSMASGVALALILALNSAISLGYYVPLLSTILFHGHDPDSPGNKSPVIGKPSLTVVSAVVLLATVTVYLGLFPESFDWISHAADQLYTWGAF